MKLEINKKRKLRKSTNMWKLSNTFLNVNGSQNKSKGKSKNILKQIKKEANL